MTHEQKNDRCGESRYYQDGDGDEEPGGGRVHGPTAAFLRDLDAVVSARVALARAEALAGASYDVVARARVTRCRGALERALRRFGALPFVHDADRERDEVDLRRVLRTYIAQGLIAHDSSAECPACARRARARGLPPPPPLPLDRLGRWRRHYTLVGLCETSGLTADEVDAEGRPL